MMDGGGSPTGSSMKTRHNVLRPFSLIGLVVGLACASVAAGGAAQKSAQPAWRVEGLRLLAAGDVDGAIAVTGNQSEEIRDQLLKRAGEAADPDEAIRLYRQFFEYYPF